MTAGPPEIAALRGAPHPEIHRRHVPMDEFCIRLSAGTGLDGCSGDRIREVVWPVGAIEFRPAASMHWHASKHAADWLVIALPKATIDRLELTARSLPSAPVSCGMAVVSPGVTELARACFVRAVLRERPGAEIRESGDLEAECLVCELVNRLAGGCPEVERLSERSRRRWVRLFDFIHANLEGPITLEQLARQFCLSPFHFHRLFRKTLGRSPHAFVREQRVLRARDAILDGDGSLAQIAHRTGFSSQSHMTYAFRQMLGHTPARFQQVMSPDRALRAVGSWSVRGVMRLRSDLNGASASVDPLAWRRGLFQAFRHHDEDDSNSRVHRSGLRGGACTLGANGRRRPE
ncbi:MAG: helix-turn-helix transcriptional regulator [Lautropia sp.]